MKLLLIGQMGSGKDTVAYILKQSYSYSIAKLGKYIRKHVDELFPELTDSQKRSYYQQYGEGMREFFGTFLWCEVLDKENQDTDIVIADCRQPHEIQYFTKQGYIPVAIKMNDTVRLKRIKERDGDSFDPDVFYHPTEKSAKNIINQIESGILPGYIIHNDGTLEDLHISIETLLSSIQGGD